MQLVVRALQQGCLELDHQPLQGYERWRYDLIRVMTDGLKRPDQMTGGQGEDPQGHHEGTVPHQQILLLQLLLLIRRCEQRQGHHYRGC